MAFVHADNGEDGPAFMVLCDRFFDWDDSDTPRTFADRQKDLSGTFDPNDEEGNGPGTLSWYGFSTGFIFLHEMHHSLNPGASNDVPLWDPISYTRVKGGQELTYNAVRAFDYVGVTALAEQVPKHSSDYHELWFNADSFALLGTGKDMISFLASPSPALPPPPFSPRFP